MRNNPIIRVEIVILLIFSSIFSFYSCHHEPVMLGGIDTVCFDSVIFPLIKNSCGTPGCHDGNTHESERFNATSYESIMQAVKPGNAKDSRLYQSISESGSDNLMPPSGPLNQDQRMLIEIWIEQGALQTNCQNNVCDTTGTFAYNPKIKAIIDLNCVSCHNASVADGNINLDGYDSVKYYAVTSKPGTSISYLSGSINHSAGFSPMPIAKLDDCSIQKIELWISKGINP